MCGGDLKRGSGARTSDEKWTEGEVAGSGRWETKTGKLGFEVCGNEAVGELRVGDG